jgi:hypothetical protein
VGWRRLLDDLHGRYDAAGLRREFAPTRALLGDGRCVEVRAEPLPEALAAVPSPRASWPAFVATEVQAPMVRIAAGARAGVYQCEGDGRAFHAVFVPGDSGLRVARITGT